MRIRLLRLSFKSIKYYYFIPIVILFILIPISNYFNIQSLGVEICYDLVMNTAQNLIPITSTWWVFLILKEYIEGEGNELLYVYKSMGKTKIIDILLIVVWFYLHVGILFLAYSFFYQNMLIEYLRILIQSFVLVGALYFLVYTIKSTSLSYMFILIYYIMSMFFSKDTIFELINIYSTNEVMTINLLFTNYSYILLIGIAFFILGMWRNRHYYR